MLIECGIWHSSFFFLRSLGARSSGAIQKAPARVEVESLSRVILRRAMTRSERPPIMDL
jgi:hypothetical protein